MADENITTAAHHHDRRTNHGDGGGVSSGIYGLAFVGALIYHIQHAGTFWEGVLGVLKAIVWPAILVYKMMEFLKL